MPLRRSAESVFQDCFSTYSFHHNVIIGGGGGWPKDNQTPKSVADVGFLNYKDGNGATIGCHRAVSSSTQPPTRKTWVQISTLSTRPPPESSKGAH